MPRVKVGSARNVARTPKKKIPQKAPVNNSDSVVSEDSFEIKNSPAPSECEKNQTDSEDEYAQDFTGEMSKLLERFSSDMNKSLQAKRKKLEQFTEESTRSTTKNVLETSKNQSEERRKLIFYYQEQFNAVAQQSEEELTKIKDTEEKLQKLLVQQQKHQQQIRISHSQRMKALRNLNEQFCKGMNELEGNHIQQYSSVHNELRKEMALLQKKILMETQQQEMLNVRKHLKQLLG